MAQVEWLLLHGILFSAGAGPMALDMMIAGAMRESLPETQADWWSRFVSLSQQIAERAAPPALPPSS